ncbi:protein of unknown function [Burkholderia multivorans]
MPLRTILASSASSFASQKRSSIRLPEAKSASDRPTSLSASGGRRLAIRWRMLNTYKERRRTYHSSRFCVPYALSRRGIACNARKAVYVKSCFKSLAYLEGRL